MSRFEDVNHPAVLAGLLVAALLSSPLGAQSPHPGTRRAGHRPHPAVKAPAAVHLPCGDLVGFQVLLDRQGLSPGEIDGQAGGNFERALAAFRESRKIAGGGQPDCDSWRALGGDASGPLIADYTITDADVKGPFVPNMPVDLEEQATLPALGYQSAIEQIAERFHVSSALLQRMNPGVGIAGGNHLKVPAVTPFDANAKPAPDPEAAGITIHVSRDESAVRATRADGSLVFFAPVTSGSEHDPLPPGNWKVTSVSWLPVFHYNPDLFWDAKPTSNRATLQPGPNNPVGVVWIDVNIEHYGMHGTPEPGRIGHTQSHGCVRLTNWDAARLASLVAPGTPVVFK